MCDHLTNKSETIVQNFSTMRILLTQLSRDLDSSANEEIAVLYATRMFISVIASVQIISTSSAINPIHALQFHFCKTYFNIIVPS